MNNARALVFAALALLARWPSFQSVSSCAGHPTEVSQVVTAHTPPAHGRVLLDPVFVGASGVPYEVHMEPNVTLNLVTTRQVYVNGRFVEVPARFRAHELTDKVLGDVGIALCSCPRATRSARRGASPRVASRGPRSPCERRIRFPVAAHEPPTLDGLPLRAGVTPLPCGGTSVNFSRHVCDPVEGSCYWQSVEPDEFDVQSAGVDEPAPHRDDQPTLLRMLRLELPQLSLVLERQHVLSAVPAHLRSRVEVCAKGARAEVADCKHAMAAVLLAGAAAPEGDVFGYVDLRVHFRALPDADAYEPMHGLLGQNALLGRGHNTLEQPQRIAQVLNEPVRGRLGRAVGGGNAGDVLIDGTVAEYVISQGSLFGGDRYAHSLFDASCSSQPEAASPHGAPVMEAAGRQAR